VDDTATNASAKEYALFAFLVNGRNFSGRLEIIGKNDAIDSGQISCTSIINLKPYSSFFLPKMILVCIKGYAEYTRS
jgi:hypothetical protein